MKCLLRIEEIEKKIGYFFDNKDLLYLAFVHSSCWNENRQTVTSSNERLEFLGDSVLGMIAAEFLYSKFPDLTEGKLSSMRSLIVDSPSCTRYAKKLEIENYILLGKGEQLNAGKGRDTIIADLFEALMGAIYLDKGFASAKEFFFRNFAQEMEEIVSSPISNWKAELQEYVQKRYAVPPIYEVLQEWGPAHQKNFRIAVFINQEKIGEGEGGSKKLAQQKAAFDALSSMKQKTAPSDEKRKDSL